MASAGKPVFLARAETIASRDNRWLKKFRAALRGGESSADGWIGVEGTRLVEEALRSGLPIEAVLVSTSGERDLARLARWIPPDTRILHRHEGMISGVASGEDTTT